jgi:hypothetical protein
MSGRQGSDRNLLNPNLSNRELPEKFDEHTPPVM